jgi:hypothetical protein
MGDEGEMELVEDEVHGDVTIQGGSDAAAWRPSCIDISHPIPSYPIPSYHIVPYRNASRPIASQRIASYCVASYRIVSHGMAWDGMALDVAHVGGWGRRWRVKSEG